MSNRLAAGNKMALKVIILDFDGVIVESNGIKAWAFQELFKGHSNRLGEIMAYHNAQQATIRFDQFRHVTETILGEKYTPGREKELSGQFTNLIVDRIIQCPFVLGAQDFLEYFYPRLPMYLASINPAEDLNRILEERQLKKYFKGVYAHPWKKKDAIAEILKKEGAAKNEAVFIGDTTADGLAAKEAGVEFIGRLADDCFETLKVATYKNMKEIKDVLVKRIEQ